MTRTADPQRHLRAVPGDVAPYVLIPGDPGRADRIAERFAEARLIARHREYTLYTGVTEAGTPISVCSTGIGGPSASIAVEELVRVGATHFIRVGSAGGRQPHIPIGSTVIVTAAYRGEGTSLDYVPLPFPAVADLDVTLALRRAAEAVIGHRAIEGIVYTRDAFYRRDDGTNARLTEAGVVLGSDAPAYRFSVQIGGTDYDYVVRVRREGNEPVSIEARCACTKSDVVAFAVDKVMESSTGLASSTSPPVVDVDSEVQPVPDEETAPRDRAARVGPLGVTGIVVMIGGAAAMVAGGVMLGRGERESLVGDDDERVRIDDLRPAGRAALGVGAGALAVGVVFVVLDQTVSKRRRRAVSLAPDVGPRGLALRLTGRF